MHGQEHTVTVCRRAAFAFALMTFLVVVCAQGADECASEWRKPPASKAIVGARVYTQNAIGWCSSWERANRSRASGPYGLFDCEIGRGAAHRSWGRC